MTVIFVNEKAKMIKFAAKGLTRANAQTSKHVRYVTQMLYTFKERENTSVFKDVDNKRKKRHDSDVNGWGKERKKVENGTLTQGNR